MHTISCALISYSYCCAWPLLFRFFFSFLFALKPEAVKKWGDEGEAQSFAGCILVRNAEAMVRPEPLSRICFFTCSLICVGMIRTQKKRKRRREDESATKIGKKKVKGNAPHTARS